MLFSEYWDRLMLRPQIRPSPRRPTRKTINQIILFGRHPNPTTDYYFGARLSARGMPPYEIVDMADRNLHRLNPEGAFIIICRYASSRVLDWIEASHSRLAGVGLFLDDDIPSVILSDESSIRYKLSLLKNAIMPLRRLNRELDILWVSTPKLAEAVGCIDAQVLPPAPPTFLWDVAGRKSSRADSETISIAYHATGIHVKEHSFLQPVIADVLAARPNAIFEVFADNRTRPIWKGMDRVDIRDPLPWQGYVKECENRQIDIMLVPLAPTKVNDCRSPTKRIDVARLEAAGIFSASSAYGEPDGSCEIRLLYNRDIWHQTLLELIDDPARRAAGAEATRLLVGQMSSDADSGLLLNSA
ncbi:hypothetical protein EPK99_09730 [Neorhizobium lilium]|uniref:Glycosyltransferase family 1 protein n=1 Tax=Neorhizobium lilium TaxID=2503024 RepID=A0A444LII1_9HYPH|nr:hypothetical protein [Neorhizobium lilium]RWX78850.1 hypothetical protein EPK99_09730 [Neorhizobium lilium]